MLFCTVLHNTVQHTVVILIHTALRKYSVEMFGSIRRFTTSKAFASEAILSRILDSSWAFLKRSAASLSSFSASSAFVLGCDLDFVFFWGDDPFWSLSSSPVPAISENCTKSQLLQVLVSALLYLVMITNLSNIIIMVSVFYFYCSSDLWYFDAFELLKILHNVMHMLYAIIEARVLISDMRDVITIWVCSLSLYGIHHLCLYRKLDL